MPSSRRSRANSEMRRTDRCLVSLDTGEGVTLEDRDEGSSALTFQRTSREDGLWTARQVAVRERWAHVNEPQRSQTTAATRRQAARAAAAGRSDPPFKRDS